MWSLKQVRYMITWVYGHAYRNLKLKDTRHIWEMNFFFSCCINFTHFSSHPVCFFLSSHLQHNSHRHKSHLMGFGADIQKLPLCLFSEMCWSGFCCSHPKVLLRRCGSLSCSFIMWFKRHLRKKKMAIPSVLLCHCISSNGWTPWSKYHHAEMTMVYWLWESQKPFRKLRRNLDMMAKLQPNYIS